MQDWLHLGAEARINIPSTLGGRNWQWRLLPGQLTVELGHYLREQTALYGRFVASEATEGERVFIEVKDGAGLVVPKSKAEEHLAQRGLRVLTSGEMRTAEIAAVAAGVGYEELMENAGTAAAQSIMTLAAQRKLERTALMLCGRGNNAGDAFVAARLLTQQGWRVQVLPLCGSEYSQLAKLNFDRMPKEVELVSEKTADFAAGFLVDGVFGIGFYGDLPPAVALVMKRTNAAGGLRVALDVPSGLNCDTGDAVQFAFHADYTLTFGAYKPALRMPLAAAFYGDVQCWDIGL
jgi:NAD(P)H-hydrate epimerase